jgi:hypothetical protein
MNHQPEFPSFNHRKRETKGNIIEYEKDNIIISIINNNTINMKYLKKKRRKRRRIVHKTKNEKSFHILKL